MHDDHQDVDGHEDGDDHEDVDGHEDVNDHADDDNKDGGVDQICARRLCHVYR